MNLLIDNRTDEPLTAELEDAIRRAAAEALRYEEFDEDCEISVSIVDNEEIREINRQFRSIDRATDVLSFPMLTFAEGEEAEVNENDEIVLGDIIISLERAKEQAEEYGHSLKREIAFLTAHWLTTAYTANRLCPILSLVQSSYRFSPISSNNFFSSFTTGCQLLVPLTLRYTSARTASPPGTNASILACVILIS